MKMKNLNLAESLFHLVPGNMVIIKNITEKKNNDNSGQDLNDEGFEITVANESHLGYIDEILHQIADAAQKRGTGIAKRSPEYIRQKMLEGKAIIALKDKKFAGFCYIESWGHQKYVANSGLIVVPEYRGQGLAKQIKKKAFELSRQKFPEAKLFGLTTGLAVMKINTELGYRPVTFSELTDDEEFWKGCESCINHDILVRTNRKYCLCTGMLYDPAWEKEKENTQKAAKNKFSLKTYEKWIKFKQNILMKRNNKNK
jgi:GNAT superfamily N-acetyltransferase